MTELQKDHMDAVQRGLATYQSVVQERDRLREDLEAAVRERDLANEQIKQYQLEIERLTNQAASYRAERDQAIGERSYLEGLFAVMKHTLNEAELPDPVMKRKQRGNFVQAIREGRFHDVLNAEESATPSTD